MHEEPKDAAEAKRKGDEAPAPPPKPHRDKDGKLTHVGMTAVLKKGGSVLHQGKLIEKLSELPAEEELVRHDAEARQALLDDLDRQEAEIALRRRTLMADPRTDVPTPAVPTGSPPHPQPPQTTPPHQPKPPAHQPAQSPDIDDDDDDSKGTTRRKKS